MTSFLLLLLLLIVILTAGIVLVVVSRSGLRDRRDHDPLRAPAAHQHDTWCEASHTRTPR